MACSVSSASQSFQVPANLWPAICTTTYRYNSIDIPVTIFARANGSRTVFVLQSTKTLRPADGTEKKGVKMIEGTFTLVRIWDKFHPDGKKVLHYEGDAINPRDILRNRRLYVEKICDFHPDPTGNRPISLLMMRFLVELLRRESEEQLAIRVSQQNKGFNPMIGVAGGFRIANPPDIAPPRFDPAALLKIFRDTLKEKANFGDWFPKLDFTENFDLVLHKVPFHKVPFNYLPTQFYTFYTEAKTGHNQIANVDFTYSSRPTTPAEALTWEQYIVRQKALLAQDGEILPKSVDAKYEQASSMSSKS